MSDKNDPPNRLKTGKTRITIRLDNRIVDWFKLLAEENDGASYQALINEALLKHIENQTYATEIEETIRLTIREELAPYVVNPDTERPEPEQLKGSSIKDQIPDDNPFKPFIGMFSGGSPDTARNAKEVVMEEISAKFDLPKGSPINEELPDGHPFKGIIGIFSGGDPDTAARAEEILEAEVNRIDGFGHKHE